MVGLDNITMLSGLKPFENQFDKDDNVFVAYNTNGEILGVYVTMEKALDSLSNILASRYNLSGTNFDLLENIDTSFITKEVDSGLEWRIRNFKIEK